MPNTRIEARETEFTHHGCRLFNQPWSKSATPMRRINHDLDKFRL